MSHCLDFCSSDFTSFKMVYNITEFTPKKHRIVLVMKPKYLGMWVHSAVGMFWIAMWDPQFVGSSKKIFRKQRRRHRAEWKSDPDVREEEKTDNIKTTQHCKSNQAVHHQRKILMADMRPQDNYTSKYTKNGANPIELCPLPPTGRNWGAAHRLSSCLFTKTFSKSKSFKKTLYCSWGGRDDQDRP